MKRTDTITNKEIISNNAASPVYGNNKKWFAFVSVFLVLWIAAYFYTHWNNPGYVYTRFTTAQIQQVSRILYHDPAEPQAPVPSASPVAMDTIIFPDSAKNDTIIAASRVAIMAGGEICDDSCKVNKAVLYIKEVFDNNIKEDQLDLIRQYVGSSSSHEVGLFLADAKIKVKSFFWLTGPLVYLEITFWVIIGVICSILFSLGNLSRSNKNAEMYTNDRDMPYQIAKLFYAPFCTIILVLTYNYIKHRNIVEVNTNEGIIVFSFMAGIFSGRLMSLLERFKDVLLPEHTVTTPILSTPIDITHTQQSSIGAFTAPLLAKKQQVAEQSGINGQPDTDRPVKMQKNPARHEKAEEVVIELKLNNIGLFEEELKEVTGNKFNNAIVTLHKVNGKEIIPASYKSENGKAAFVADFVEPGIYIVRGTIVQQLANHQTINLFGEKTTFISPEQNHIDLFIKKFESLD